MGDLPAIDFAEPVALFPLPQCLLLPHAIIPLHIFEPRYRRLITDALDSRGLLAMASFEGEGWKLDYEGTPPIRPHVCVGHIVRHEGLADGRSNILLQGICRARIRREIDHSPYRMAILAATEPEPLMDIDLDEHRKRIENLLHDKVLRRLAVVSAIHNWLTPEVATHAVIDLTIMNVTDDVEQRYALLAEADAAERARWLERFLIEARQIIKTAQRHTTLGGGLEVTFN